LRVDPCESKILISEPILNAKEEREKSAEIMFETFNVPSLYIANQGVLSFYSTGRAIGVDLESGDGVTQIVPIYEGFYISHAVQRIDIGGKDLTDFMMRLLTEKGRRFSSSSEIEVTENIKEKCCYLPSIENENKSIETYIYELPDGTNINIRDERVKCPLALFNPKLLNKEGLGIADACYHCVQKCDIDLRKELYYSVIL
jgi:actin-related protein